MNGLRVWVIFSWIALPTVMYGGYSLLQLINRGNALTPFQVTWFRAGHAHAGVLLLMSLLYYTFLDKTSFSPAVKHSACATLVLRS
jgi:Ni,Fe-hydrogenase I cytochrome b subunit